MNTPLQNSSLTHLHKTLEDLASAERQIRYKNAAPSVHIPTELQQHWGEHLWRLRSQAWFYSLFAPAQVDAMERFALRWDEVWTKVKHSRQDVPEILDNPAWQSLMESARLLLPDLPRPESSEAQAP